MLPSISSMKHRISPSNTTGSMGDTTDPENSLLRPSYRRRVRSGLHQLHEGTQVTSASGRHDKLEITLQGTVTFAREEDLVQLITTQHLQTLDWPNVLNAPRGSGGRLHLHPVSKKEWLFSGKLRYGRAPQANQRQVRLELSVNPTRFAAYACRFNPERVVDLGEIPPHELLRRDPEWRKRLKSNAPADWDNYLSGLGQWITVVTREWQDLVDLYLRTIIRLVVVDFAQRAAVLCSSDPPVLSFQDPAAAAPLFHHGEVYWEFGVDDARLSYAALEEKLRVAAPKFAVKERYDLREGRDAAARWISVDLRNGVALTAYTKLSGRIRLEVAYTARQADRTIGQLLHPDLHFTSGMSFHARLERLREDGARRLNEVLAGLPDLTMTQVADDISELSGVLAEIAKLAKGNRDLIRNALSQLVSEGAIDAPPRTLLCKIAEGLEKKGAMERIALVERNRTRRYALKGSLAHTFRRLSDAGAD
ncbi:hypothetical protein HPT29_002265 [Microvirga terrae]|uniref:Uncharacterized protein n=1 Tax=Microvirga terrae TaxID=2740529 RepID=A0ABY5RRW5_9HYPH|nr:hypothetical protein [Microvirga terrae]UVF19998.1 hypothetical protein HPT29_002265 [Microvirga terrae]